MILSFTSLTDIVISFTDKGDVLFNVNLGIHFIGKSLTLLHLTEK